jgi:penicillin amidase
LWLKGELAPVSTDWSRLTPEQETEKVEDDHDQ